MNQRFRQIMELSGWVIFVASAAFFLIASYRAGDMYATAGSALFLLACLFFLAPYVVKTDRALD